MFECVIFACGIGERERERERVCVLYLPMIKEMRKYDYPKFFGMYFFVLHYTLCFYLSYILQL